jgi:ribonuclease HI
MREAKAFCDGSGNSARIQACAAILYVGQEKFSRARLLPPHTTNNVGEYSGVLLALQLAKELEIERLTIYSDSLLVVNQTAGEWACRSDSLRVLLDRFRKVAKEFRRVDLLWIPRAENEEADALCRLTIKAASRIR